MAALALGGAALRCGGAGLAGAGAKDREKKDDADETNEDEKGSKPVAVSGAFLTCDEADDAAAMDANTTMYGCALKNNKSQKRIAGVAGDPVVKGTGEDGSVITFPSRGGLTSGAWHLHYGVPKGFKGNARLVAVTMTLDGKKVVATTGSLDKPGQVSGDWSFETGHSDLTDLEYTEEKENKDEGGTGATPASPAPAPTPPPPKAKPTKRYFFVTSVPVAVGSDFGKFNSRSDAGEVCRFLIKNHALKGSDWVAVLSKHEEALKDGTRLKTDLPIVNLKDQTIWPAGADPYTVAPTDAIRWTEASTDLDGSARVWTGTKRSGSKGQHCDNWKSTESGKKATVGKPSDPTAWLEDEDVNCGDTFTEQKFHLYCVTEPRP